MNAIDDDPQVHNLFTPCITLQRVALTTQ